MSKSMQKTSSVFKSIFSLLLFSVAVSLYAVPASPRVYEVIQPDGTSLEIRNMGDEFYSWKETKDGYAVRKNAKTGFFEYLKVNADGKFESTGRIAGETDPDALGIEKNAREGKKVILEQIAASPLKTVAPVAEAVVGEDGIVQKTVPQQISAVGSKKMFVILAQFSNVTPKYTKNDYLGLYNTLGYNSNGANGSVRDYYREASYTNLDLQGEVCGWVVLPNTREYYADKPAEMVIDAINGMTVADKDKIKNPIFDADGDKVLDIPIDIIHSGYGQEETGDPNDIWSHKWDLTSAEAYGDGTGPVNLNGITINEYHTEPAKSVATGGITTIGVICHETGHAFGLPDLYDTTSAGEGLGSWAIMAAGGWNGNGTRPAHFCSWSKKEMQWLTPTGIANNQTNLTIGRLSAVAKAYKISTGGVALKEYFLIENRGNYGFDDSLPSFGLLVYHIDDNKDPVNNTDNNPPHYRVRLMQADGNWDLENGVNRGDAGDPYPGTTLNRTIDSTTDPSTDSYYNSPGGVVDVATAVDPPVTATEIVISNISDVGSIMTFDAKVDDSDFLVVQTGTTTEIDTLTVNENGGSATFQVVLSKQPTNDVLINLAVTSNLPDPAENNITIDKAQLTFTSANWDTAQTVTVTGVNEVYAGDDTSVITISVDATSDVKYTPLADKYLTVTCISDDVSGITVTPHAVPPAIALTINEKAPGNVGTFDVELNARPRNNVVLKIESVNPGEVVANLSQMTFTTNDWDTPQTLTVTAIDDSYVGDDTGTIRFTVVTASSDSGYSTVAGVDELVLCTDDESIAGQTADFNLLPPVWVANKAYLLSDYVASTAGQWYICIAAGTSGAKEPTWDTTIGNPTTDNTITWQRVATPGAPTPVTLPIMENGGKSSFRVVLNGRPHVPVKIDVASSSTAELTVSKSSLTFTKDNWNVPQSVSVTGVNDNLVGDQQATVELSVNAASSDSHFSAATNTATYNIINEDVAAFTIKPTAIIMGENYEVKEFTVVLLTGPVATNVQMDIASSDTNECTVSPATLTFNKTNYNIPQIVRITSVPDYTLGNDTAIVSVTPNDAASDPLWLTAGAVRPAAQNVNVTLINDDVAGFTLSTKTLTVKEGTNENYTIVLNAEPDSNVIINATSSDTAEVTLTAGGTATTAITFTPVNWNVPQAVQVNGVIDEYATDDKANVVNTLDSTSDPNFRNLKLQTVVVTVTNDNAINSAEIVLNGALADSTLTINELAPGNTGTFNVMLDAKPHSNVYVKVDSLSPTEATVDTVQLTFTPSNWNVAQLVTVTGVDNNFLGDGTSDVRLKVVGLTSDPTFKTATERTCVVTITENDPNDAGGINITEDAIVVQENAGKKTFYISLTGRPRTDVKVTFDIPVVVPVIAKTTPAYVTFTTSSWNTPKKITVIGDPTRQSVAIDTTTITLTPTGDAAWLAARNADPGPIDVTVTTDTSSGFDVTPPELDIDENDPAGNPGTGEIKVVLTQQPNGNVTVALALSNANITLNTNNVVFTNANWFTPQTVTVSNNSGDIADDVTTDVTCSISAAPADPAFLTLPNQLVVVTVKNLNPVALDDIADAVSNKNGMAIANEAVIIRVLNNDTDPGDNTLTVKSVTAVAGGAGGAAVINADNTTISYTPVTSGTATFSYIATNSLGGFNDDSPAADVTVTVYEGQPVAYGSMVQVLNTDVPVANFTRSPKVYVNYFDPIKDPGSLSQKNYSLKSLTQVFPAATVDNEFKKMVRIYDRQMLNIAYRDGISFDDYKGQATSLKFDVNVNTGTADTPLTWKLLLKPPVITSVERFSTPYDNITTIGSSLDLHAGSIMYISGNYFGNKTPKVWLEYTDPNGRIKMARCRVLKYTPYTDASGTANKGYMDVDPTSATYGTSGLKVMLPTKFPADWDYAVNYKVIVDNGVGMASYSGLVITVPSADNNTAPTAADDTFNGANAVKANTKNNQLDVLDNDTFPNCDEVNVTIEIPPDNKGKARFNRKTGTILYTPAKDFGAAGQQIETFTYRITEKYTDQKLSSTATVQVTVGP